MPKNQSSNHQKSSFHFSSFLSRIWVIMWFTFGPITAHGRRGYADVEIALGEGGITRKFFSFARKMILFFGFFCIIQINGERNSTRNAITKVIQNRVIHQHWHTALYANEHAQTPIFSCTITRASDKFNWELTSICCRVNILRIWTTFLVIWRRRVSTHVAFRRRLGPD